MTCTKKTIACLVATSAALIQIGCSSIPLDERAAHIRYYNNAPSCEFTELGRVSAADGFERMDGQSGDWQTTANEERARARLREESDALGGTAVIQDNRRAQMIDGTVTQVELRGRAIEDCR